MSLDKSIETGKERRRSYQQSKKFDKSCRNHGSCDYCKDNRLHKFETDKLEAENKIKSWENEYYQDDIDENWEDYLEKDKDLDKENKVILTELGDLRNKIF